MRTNSAQSAEFYEAVGVPGVKDGTLMFRIRIQELAHRDFPPTEFDSIAEEGHKKSYPAAWDKFLAGQAKVLEVAIENERASLPEPENIRLEEPVAPVVEPEVENVHKKHKKYREE